MKSLEDMVEVIKKYKRTIRFIDICLYRPDNKFKYYHHDIHIWFTKEVMIDGELYGSLYKPGFRCKKSNAKQTVEDFVEKLRVLGFDFLKSMKSYNYCILFKPSKIEDIYLDHNDRYITILKPGRVKVRISKENSDLLKQSLENHERYDLLLKL